MNAYVSVQHKCMHTSVLNDGKGHLKLVSNVPPLI